MKSIPITALTFLVTLCGCYSPEKNSAGIEFTDPLVVAVQMKDHERMLDLIESGYPIEGRTEQKNEPAYWAIATNNKAALQALIEHGLDVNHEWGFKGGNLLTNAVQFGYSDIVKVLVEGGAVVSREPKYGRSPLYASIIYDKKEIEQYLRSKGAEFNDWDLEALGQIEKTK